MKKLQLALLLFFILSCNNNTNTNTKEDIGTTTIDNIDTSKEQPMEKYTSDEIEDYKNQVRNVIKQCKEIQINDNESLDDIQIQLQTISSFWNSIEGNIIEAKIDSTTFPFKTQDSAINILKKYQKKYFPKLRKAFVYQTNKKLWIDDAGAYASGDDNEFITFTGNYFLPNANKQETAETLMHQLQRLRFKMLLFRWFKGDDNPTVYEIKSDWDDDIFTYE